MSDRFWWRKHLRPEKNSLLRVAIVGQAGVWGENVANTAREAGDIGRAQDMYGVSANEVAACLAWADYADEHPEMSGRQLLGLPEPEEKDADRFFQHVKWKRDAYASVSNDINSLSMAADMVHAELWAMYENAIDNNPIGFRDALINIAAECQRACEQLVEAGVISWD